MQVKFGKKAPTVQQMQGRDKDAAAWNTVREWTGGAARVTPAIRATVARISEAK